MKLEDILALTDNPIINHRGERYRGGALAIALDALTPDEQELVKRQYEQVSELYQITSAREPAELKKKAVEQFARGTELISLQDQLTYAQAEVAADRPKRVHRVLYDLSAGAFSSICGHILLIQAGGMEDEYPHSLFYLTRDHLKLSRALVSDLDEDRRSRDELLKQHDLDLLLEKWQAASYRAFDEEIEVSFVCHYNGTVAERCLEFAELDGVFYHLANNCLRHTSDNRMQIALAALPDGENLRWVFRNNLTPSRQAALQEMLNSGQSLFEHGVKVGSLGRGYGLGEVADTIQYAYGLEDLHEAQEQGYFGVEVKDRIFSLWFHWPRVPAIPAQA